MTHNTTSFEAIKDNDVYNVGDILSVDFGREEAELFQIIKYGQSKAGLMVLHGESLGTLWTWGEDVQYYLKLSNPHPLTVTREQLEKYINREDITISRVKSYTIMLDYD